MKPDPPIAMVMTEATRKMRVRKKYKMMRNAMMYNWTYLLNRDYARGKYTYLYNQKLTHELNSKCK